MTTLPHGVFGSHQNKLTLSLAAALLSLPTADYITDTQLTDHTGLVEKAPSPVCNGVVANERACHPNC